MRHNGNIDDLMKAAQFSTICNLTGGSHGVSLEEKDEHTAKTFSKLILGGKVHSALRFLSNNACGGILSLDASLDGGTTSV